MALNFTCLGSYALIVRPRFWYEMCFVFSASIAVAYDTPAPTAYALLEIFLWESNKPFLHTIKTSAKQLVSTVLVGFLLVYLFLLVGLFTMPDLVDLSSCSTVFQCAVFRSSMP